MRQIDPPRINKGVYRHYKGKLYDVLDVARHSETDEWYVVYRAHDVDEGHVWVRPYHMFFEIMTLEGKTTPRFAHIRGENDSLA